jgi:membrane protease YdiL (CAAX protease family)
MSFQQIALFLTLLWLLVVMVRFRRSTVVLIGGLVLIGLYTFVALACGQVSADSLGLSAAHSWLRTAGFALLWLGLMLAYSPVADWLATRLIAKPPTLEAFRAIQQSRAKLVAGIVVAWVLGAVLEELVFRGVVLRSLESLLAAWLAGPVAAGIAICAAALGAGVVHLYQGPRALVIITQLSILFGVLFVVSGHDLWAVMLCHGLYDTIAFIRFAGKKSKYSNLEGSPVSSSQT